MCFDTGRLVIKTLAVTHVSQCGMIVQTAEGIDFIVVDLGNIARRVDRTGKQADHAAVIGLDHLLPAQRLGRC